MPPLAHVGINIDVSWELIQRPKEVRPLRAHDKMCSEVNVLRLFPGLTTSTVKTFLAEPIKGVILESYGAGNAPSRKDLLETFREASERGVVIVNITQCLQGEVSAIYAVGKKLESVGVVAGGDMTPEVSFRERSHRFIFPLTLSIFVDGPSILFLFTVRSYQALLFTRKGRTHSDRSQEADGEATSGRAYYFYCKFWIFG